MFIPLRWTTYVPVTRRFRSVPSPYAVECDLPALPNAPYLKEDKRTIIGTIGTDLVITSVSIPQRAALRMKNRLRVDPKSLSLRLGCESVDCVHRYIPGAAPQNQVVFKCGESSPKPENSRNELPRQQGQRASILHPQPHWTPSTSLFLSQ
jgi:hypothetical protein